MAEVAYSHCVGCQSRKKCEGLELITVQRLHRLGRGGLTIGFLVGVFATGLLCLALT